MEGGSNRINKMLLDDLQHTLKGSSGTERSSMGGKGRQKKRTCLKVCEKKKRS